MKSILYVFRHSSWQGRAAADGLDALMASCAMELEVAALFLHEGVLNLRTAASVPDELDYKPKLDSKPFKALNDFGCETVLVCERSLVGRGLTKNELVLDAQLLSRDGIAERIDQYDQVLVF